MKGQQIVSLKSLSEKITKGTTPTSLGSSFTDFGINFIKAESYTDYGIFNPKKFAYIDEATHYKLKRSQLQKDDVIISIAGVLGRCAIVTDSILPANTNQAVGIIRLDRNKALPQFIHYHLSSPSIRAYINQLNGQAAQPNINLTQLGGLKIPLPSLLIQKKIAAILGAYDNLIENNLKRIKLLEEKAQLTYEEWFVRMKFPGHETTPINNETGLPEGWIERKIGDVCIISGGGTPSKAISEFWDQGTIDWFSPTDLSKSGSLIQLNSATQITELGLKKSSAKLLQRNSFMMTSRATIGLFGIIDKPFSTNQGFINVTPIENFEKEYLIYNFKKNIPLFINYATGATFLEISKSVFKQIKIKWPSIKLLKNFNEIVYPIHQEMLALTKQNKLLREARDILLPRLMTGVIDVDKIKLEDLQPITA